MKAVQVTFDESLLKRLDADDEVRSLGRSAVVRRPVGEFLRRKQEASIDAAYRRGYADFEGLGPEFEGWESMGWVCGGSFPIAPLQSPPGSSSTKVTDVSG